MYRAQCFPVRAFLESVRGVCVYGDGTGIGVQLARVHFNVPDDGFLPCHLGSYTVDGCGHTAYDWGECVHEEHDADDDAC